MLGRTIFVSVPSDERSISILRNSIEPLGVDGLSIDSWISQSAPGHFSSVIGRRIAASTVFIGVFTGTTGNVAFETGKAVGLGKPLLLIAPTLNDVPTMLLDTDVVVCGSGDINYERLKGEIDKRLDLLLCGQFADERVRAHVAQLRRKPYKPRNASSKVALDYTQEADVLARAIAKYNGGHYPDAIQMIESGIESRMLGTSNGLAYYYLADSYFLLAEGLPEGEEQAHLYFRMLRVAEKGHRIFPADERLHKTLGLAHLKCRNLEQAKGVFCELVKAHPGYTLAHYNMACVHAQCHELIPCISVLRDLFASAKKNESWRFLARLDPDFDPLWEEDLLQRVLYPTAH